MRRGGGGGGGEISLHTHPRRTPVCTSPYPSSRVFFKGIRLATLLLLLLLLISLITRPLTPRREDMGKKKLPVGNAISSCSSARHILSESPLLLLMAKLAGKRSAYSVQGVSILTAVT